MTNQIGPDDYKALVARLQAERRARLEAVGVHLDSPSTPPNPPIPTKSSPSPGEVRRRVAAAIERAKETEVVAHDRQQVEAILTESRGSGNAGASSKHTDHIDTRRQSHPVQPAQQPHPGPSPGPPNLTSRPSPNPSNDAKFDSRNDFQGHGHGFNPRSIDARERATESRGDVDVNGELAARTAHLVRALPPGTAILAPANGRDRRKEAALEDRRVRKARSGAIIYRTLRMWVRRWLYLRLRRAAVVLQRAWRSRQERRGQLRLLRRQKAASRQAAKPARYQQTITAAAAASSPHHHHGRQRKVDVRGAMSRVAALFRGWRVRKLMGSRPGRQLVTQITDMAEAASGETDRAFLAALASQRRTLVLELVAFVATRRVASLPPDRPKPKVAVQPLKRKLAVTGRASTSAKGPGPAAAAAAPTTPLQGTPPSSSSRASKSMSASPGNNNDATASPRPYNSNPMDDRPIRPMSGALAWQEMEENAPPLSALQRQQLQQAPATPSPSKKPFLKRRSSLAANTKPRAKEEPEPARAEPAPAATAAAAPAHSSPPPAAASAMNTSNHVQPRPFLKRGATGRTSGAGVAPPAKLQLDHIAPKVNTRRASSAKPKAKRDGPGKPPGAPVAPAASSPPPRGAQQRAASADARVVVVDLVPLAGGSPPRASSASSPRPSPRKTATERREHADFLANETLSKSFEKGDDLAVDITDPVVVDLVETWAMYRTEFEDQDSPIYPEAFQEDRGSIIPKLNVNSLFFQMYSDDQYESLSALLTEKQDLLGATLTFQKVKF